MAKVRKHQHHHRKQDHSKKRNRHDNVCRRLKTIAISMITLLRYYIDLLIDQIFGLYYNSRVQPIKGADNPILLQSATSLARQIRKRELTSEEVVRAFIERIEDVNPLLNAVVDNRFKEAIALAKEVDLKIATGEILECDFRSQPFLGVPFTSKESTACKNMSHTFGLVSRKNKKATYTADIVERMEAAGAILIAVTNVPQLNLWQETGNPIYGTTNNPYNNTRNVGGSSGGEASIIAACGSPIGLGTDIGGSLRIPSFMCGIFGHKPTCHLVSTKGLTFRTGKEKDTMVAAGPMARYTEDIIPCLKVLLGPNADKLTLDQPVDVKNLDIYFVTNPKDSRVSPFRVHVEKMFFKIVNHFTEIGKEPQSLEIADFQYGGRLWRYWMSQEENADFNRDLANREGEVRAFKEIFNYCCMKSQFNLPVIFFLISGLLPKENEVWAQELTEKLRNKLISLLGTNGVLLYPSAPWPASYHHTSLLRPYNFNLFAIWNALKLPVTQVPLGLNEEGLPLGVQVVAAPFQDHLCIAVAKELEKKFGGYVPPFTIEGK